MLAHHWGIKTFYYSLINKQGSKSQEVTVSSPSVSQQDIILDDADCEACKL